MKSSIFGGLLLFFSLVAIGCWQKPESQKESQKPDQKNEPSAVSTNQTARNYEIKSNYELGYTEGYLSAYQQMVDSGNIKPNENYGATVVVVPAVSEEENDFSAGYVNGYHNAIDNIQQNLTCPHIK